MIRVLLVFLAELIAFQTHAFTWQDLWYNPDQQAHDLMQKGQFSQAKKIFKRSDWKAAAAYKDGDYEKAAELFREFKTEQGYYNQGNALAHLGQYEQAIQAYDNALRLNPDNEDAKLNRKLVEELMKKDKEKRQNHEQQNQNQQNKDQQNQDQQNQNQQNQNQQNKDQQNQGQQNQNQQNQSQQNKDQQNQGQQNKNQQKQQNKDQKNKNQQQSNEQIAQDKKGKINADVNSEDEREKKQAKEQWLRLIPDDPGGLLREKFLRDHLRRERGWYE